MKCSELTNGFTNHMTLHQNLLHKWKHKQHIYAHLIKLSIIDYSVSGTCCSMHPLIFKVRVKVQSAMNQLLMMFSTHLNLMFSLNTKCHTYFVVKCNFIHRLQFISNKFIFKSVQTIEKPRITYGIHHRLIGDSFFIVLVSNWERTLFSISILRVELLE